MSFESDYCPCCGGKVEPYEVLGRSWEEDEGMADMESVSCPRCGRHIRASLDFKPVLALTREEDFLKKVEANKLGLEKDFSWGRKACRSRQYIEYMEAEILEKEHEIEAIRKNIEENEEMAKNE